MTNTGFWDKKSTVDFVGFCGVKGIAFDAKQTKGKNLPLKNIEKHQIEYMIKVKKQGHAAFILVYFSDLDRYFRLDITELMTFVEKSNRKSIPLNYFINYGVEVRKGNRILLDYLKGVA